MDMYKEYKKCVRCKKFGGKCDNEDEEDTCPKWEVADNVFLVSNTIPYCTFCKSAIEKSVNFPTESKMVLNGLVYYPICIKCFGVILDALVKLVSISPGPPKEEEIIQTAYTISVGRKSEP